MLLQNWLQITAGWRSVFAQQRSFRRAVAQCLGTLMGFGRRTVSRAIWVQGRQQQDWSAEYKLHARCRWQPDALFQPVLEGALPLCPGQLLAVALDDTRLHKTGRKIPTAFFQRDPLSPKFRFNLLWGLRFLQASLLVPLYRNADASPRALPVRFLECPVVRKPSRKAPAEKWREYTKQVRTHNLSHYAVQLATSLRQALDRAGAAERILLLVGDNSFCNRTLFTHPCKHTHLLARARRDIRLCRAATQPHRFYDSHTFTPEQIRTDDSVAWQEAKVFYAGRWGDVRFKQVSQVYWQKGARKRPLRLLVIAPLPYHVPGRGRRHYRQPAFLLTTDLASAAALLLQSYFDRWQIEVNHREEKDTLGVGQAQLRSPASVPRQPALVVAGYSALLLAGILAYGPGRNDCYTVLPKWRRKASRPSCLDLLTQLRKEMVDHPELLVPFGFQVTWKSAGLCAAA